MLPAAKAVAMAYDAAAAPSKATLAAPHTFGNASCLYSSIDTRRLRRCAFLSTLHLRGYSDVDNVDGGGSGSHNKDRGGSDDFYVQSRSAIVRR
ncbi:Hypothetical predicted protein [Olea europaea subsp. europaea]|uniref:Uncharacterized protein n=1 Tax=Olea europaea subsp. europaea TaxID=158383 RepID=A0A8S0VMJ6_OLEEU|nr:Hypothetical predicted protein [Olea europaea subsp. europaea]